MTARRIAPLLGALFCLAACGGCIRVEEVLTLNPDGSVHVRLQYAMPNRLLRATEEMLAVSRDLYRLSGHTNHIAELAHPFGPRAFDKAALAREFKANRGRGVLLDKLDLTSRDAWKYIDIDCTFENVEAMSTISIFRAQRISLVPIDGGSYEMTLQLAEESGAEPPVLQPDSQQHKDLRALLPGFRVMIRIQTPEDVLDANTLRKTSRSATWSFDIDRDPNALRDIQIHSLRLAFAGQGKEFAGYRSPATPF